MSDRPTGAAQQRWLMLIHQIPPNPPALRVRVWRRMQSLGALQLKSSVYLLPDTEQALEDYQWLAEEVRRGGGDATVWRSVTVGGIDDAAIVEQFRSGVTSEYEMLAQEVRALAERTALGSERARAAARLRARFDEIVAHDHFRAPGREVVAALLETLAAKPARGAAATMQQEGVFMELSGTTWVTRADVKIDRMASAWLIRRHIDPDARFAFTRDKRYAPQGGEVRFDMYEGEYTHEGDLCTFEVLLRRHGLDDPGLARLGEIVHDVDLKDARYGHPETAGIAAVLAGIAASVSDDAARIEAAAVVLDGVIGQLRAKPASP